MIKAVTGSGGANEARDLLVCGISHLGFLLVSRSKNVRLSIVDSAEKENM